MDDSGDAAARSPARAAADEVAPTVPTDGAPLQVFAHFRILERLAQSGSGVVYRAEDERLRRVVALKILLRDFEADEERRRRFLGEARVAVGITHANVAAVYEVGEIDGRIYVAMELAAGVTLRRRLEQNALTIREAVRVASDIARGVAAAHASGVEHRDLKPDNVMLGDDGAVKVLGFGRAPPVDLDVNPLAVTESFSPTQQARVVGTPGYMSPEQAIGSAVDVRTDVFSLGVILYEMVTGRRPFSGETPTAMVLATSRDTPVAPSELNPRVPPALEAIIARCMRKRPAQRYGTANELLVALEALGVGETSAGMGESNAGSALATDAGAGRLIASRYKIEASVGRGGMGVVYRARDLRLERSVALKLLPEAAIGDGVARARLLREARAAAAFEHPNVVHIYDVGETADGGAYIAMELVQGRSWREELDSNRPFGDRLRLLREAIQALAAAHKAGLVHRDIKPDNFMLREDGRVVLLDFGLAKEHATNPTGPTAAPITNEHMIVGTLQYMSPEQANGEPVGPASDQFSMAVTAYELLTRRLPWKGATPREFIAKLLFDAPTPPSALGLPRAMDSVFARALAKRPGDRYANVDELAEALEDASAGMESATIERAPPDRSARRLATISTSVPARGDPAAKQSKRPPWLAMLAVCVFGVAALGVWKVRSTAKQAGAAGTTPRAIPVELTTTDGVLACPVLEGFDGAEPASWLGAAAAHQSCRRVTYLLGGRSARTLVPAQLLDLPPRPTDDFPADVYDATDVRERTIAAAQRRAQAYLDGRITAKDDAFALRLTLRSPDGQAQGEAEATAPTLDAVVELALGELVRAGVVPRMAELDPEVATWLGTKEPGVALAAEDLYRITSEYLPRDAVCVALLAKRDAVTPLVALVEQLCDGGRVAGREGIGPFDAAIATPPALAHRAHLEYIFEGASADEMKMQLRRLDELLATARGTLERAMLLEARAWLLTRVEGYSSSRAGFLELVVTDPRLARAWGPLATATAGTPSFEPTIRAAQAWSPSSGYVCSTAGRNLANLTYLRRAATLEFSAVTVINLAKGLIGARRREELRALAARVTRSPPNADQDLATWVSVMLDTSDGKPGAAFARATAYLSARVDNPLNTTAEFSVWEAALDLALVLGRAPSLADKFGGQIRAHPPHTPGRGKNASLPIAIAGWCALASPAVAKGCLAELRALLAARYFPAPLSGTHEALACAEASLTLSARAAADACRPAIPAARLQLNRFAFMGMIFDRAGLPDLADSVDPLPKTSIGIGGVTSGHVRAARRAAARGDHARARMLAQQIIDAWALADVPIPAVDEMRSLLRDVRR